MLWMKPIVKLITSLAVPLGNKKQTVYVLIGYMYLSEQDGPLLPA